MKKFTIFLLTFLLFVGFINVNAQTRAGIGVTSAVQSGLRCSATGTVTIPVAFTVTLDDGHYTDLTEPEIHVSTDNGSTWYVIDEHSTDPVMSFIANFFSVNLPITGSMLIYGTIKEDGVLLSSLGSDGTIPPIELHVLSFPEVSIDPTTLTDLVCTGGSVTLSGAASWDIPEADGITINYTWSDGTNTYPGNYASNYDHTAPLVWKEQEFTNLTLGTNTFTFAISVIDLNGKPSVLNSCDANTYISFEVLAPPTVEDLEADIERVCEDGFVTISATPDFTYDGDYELVTTLYVNGDPVDENIQDLDATKAIIPVEFIVDIEALVTAGTADYGANTFKVVTKVNAVPANVYGDDFTCEGEDEITITVLKKPVAVIAGPDTLKQCDALPTAGNTFTLTGNAPNTGEGETGLWSVDKGSLTTTVGNVTTVTVAPGDTAFVVWTISKEPCDPARDTVMIVVFENPTLTVEPVDLVACQFEDAEIIAKVSYNNQAPAPDYTYVWVSTGVDGTSDGSITDESAYEIDTDDPVTGGSFSVTVTDGNGCERLAEGSITVYEIPEVEFDETEYKGCEDGTLIITATVTGGSSSGDYSYLWETTGDIDGTGVDNVFTVNTATAHVGTGTVILTVRDNIDEPEEIYCYVEIDVPVTVYPLPTQAAITEPTNPSECAVDGEFTFQMEANAPITGERGEWVVLTDDADMPVTGFDIEGPTDPEATITVPEGYSVEVAWRLYNTDYEECYTQDEITLTTWALPIITLSGVDTVCLNETLIVQANTGSTGMSWDWTGSTVSGTYSATIASFTVDTSIPQDGYVSVIGEDGNGCKSIEVKGGVKVNALPVVTFTLGITDICIDADPLTLTGGSSTSTGTGVYSGTGVTDGVFYPDVAGVSVGAPYTITYTFTDENGCENSATQPLTVRALPTATLSYSGGALCAEGTLLPTFTKLTGEGTLKNLNYTSDPALDIDEDNGEINLAGAITQEYTITCTFEDDYCSNTVETTIHIYGLPDIEEIEIDALPCPGETATLSTTVTSPAGCTYAWYEVVGGIVGGPALSTSLTCGITGRTTTATYRFVATTPTSEGGCSAHKDFEVEPANDPVTNITFGPIPTKICNHNTINLTANIAGANGNQNYIWYIYKNTGTIATPNWDTGNPIPYTSLTGTYKIDMDDDVVQIYFEIYVNTNGLNCPHIEHTPTIGIDAGINIEIIGNKEDIVCEGGSVKTQFELSNIALGTGAAPVYYRWLENGLALNDIYQEYLLPPGINMVEFTTNPALHENELGPKSYCYQLEIWQGVPDPLEPDQCHTFSECYQVTVLKDPVLMVSGPTFLPKDTPSAEFTANIAGGHGNATYQWFLNGTEVTGVTGNVYVLTDQAVLGNIGDYFVAVKAIQDCPGCDAQLVYHHFKVGCPPATVTISGPNSGCVGETLHLVAIVETEATEYLLKWKKDGNYLVDENELMYEEVIGDSIAVIEYQLEVSLCGCEVVYSPILYFQVVPKPVVVIDNYKICENGAVEVEANAIVFDGGIIYRYLWFDDINGDPIDTTYENHRLFEYKDMTGTGGVSTYYVQVEMLNAACHSEMTPFTITVQGTLKPVEIDASTTVTCLNTLVFFSLGEDENILEYGEPTITWWVDGIEVPGENLNYLNIPFDTEGVHYVYARLAYPGNNCELVTTQVQVAVGGLYGVEIAGPTLVCNSEVPAVLYAIVNPVGYEATLTYQWYLNGEEIIGGDKATQDISTTPSPEPYIYVVVVSELQTGCVVQSAAFTVYVEEFSVVGITADKTETCPGETVILTANITETSNMTYRWLDDNDNVVGNAPICQVYPTETTIYRFEAQQNGTTCTATSNPLTITVIPLPIVTEKYEQYTICQGAQQSVFASVTNLTDVTYTWYINGQIVAENASYIFNYLYEDAGTFDVQVKVISNVAGCTSALTYIATVYVLPVPQVHIEGPAIVCNTENPANLYAVTDPLDEFNQYEYLWYEHGALMGSTNNIPVSNVASPYPYVYVVKVTDPSTGCVSISAEHYVYVNEAPQVGISADVTETCPGETVILTAQITEAPNMTYRWLDDAGNIVGTAPICQVYPTETTIYRFEAQQNGTTCIATSNPLTITVIPLPIVTEKYEQFTICQGTQQMVFASVTNVTNVTYTWYINGQIVAENASYILNYLFENEGTFDVQVKAISDVAGCTSTLTYIATVYVKAAPQVHIEGPSIVCNAETPTHLYAVTDPLDLFNQYEYLWYEHGALMGSTNNIQVSNIASPYPYVYVVKVTDPTSGCVTISAEHYVYVNEFPVIGITADKTEICAGETVMLTANVSGDDNMIYQWKADDIDISGANGPVLYVNPLVTTVYTFTATQIGSLCVATSNEATVTVIPTPEIVSGNPKIETICRGEQVTFEVTVTPTDESVTYAWFINGEQVPDAILPYFTPIFDHHGVFIVEVSAKAQDAPCTSGLVKVGEITVKDAPGVVIAGPEVICGEAVNATLYAVTDPVDAEVTFAWYMNDNPTTVGEDQALDISELDPSPYPYNFYVQIIDPVSLCMVQSAVHSVYVGEFAVIGITADKTKVCEGETVMLTANVSGDDNMIYQWYANGDSIKGATGPVLYVNPIVTTVYTFTAQQIESECVATSNAVTVTVVVAPQITVITDDADICEGGSVVLEATPYYPGAVYTWYENGIIIPGAVTHKIVVFPHTYDPLVTEYTYKAVVTLDPGCTSDESEEVVITVTPQPEVYVEGPATVCENEPFTLYGYSNLPGLKYVWTLFGYQNTPTDMGEYPLGFNQGFNVALMSVNSSFNIAYALPEIIPGEQTYDYSEDLFTTPPACNTYTATSARDMYKAGMTQGNDGGDGRANADATLAALARAVSCAEDLRIYIEVLAKAAAIEDAGHLPLLVYDIGENYGNSRAEGFLNSYPDFVVDAVTCADYDINTLSITVPPIPITYTQACDGEWELQEVAYNAGYMLGYKRDYVRVYRDEFINSLREKIQTIYTDVYHSEFEAKYNELVVTLDPAAIEGIIGHGTTLEVPGLEARPYPYKFKFYAFNEHGCESSYEFYVNVLEADVVMVALTMWPQTGKICDGGQVELKAHVNKPENVDYYIWYENGFEIEGENQGTIHVSPLTVDQDQTLYIYTVKAVPFGGIACASNLSRPDTVIVIKNPIIELHGDHHVCDVYAGSHVEHGVPNVDITAFKNGEYQYAPYDWNCYQWYLNGPKYDLEDVLDAQHIHIYLPTSPEPYIFKVEYSGPFGCYTMSDEFLVYVHPQPVINITSSETDICVNGSVTLTANHNDYNEDDFVYQWYKNSLTDADMIPGATERIYNTPELLDVGDVTYWVVVKQTTTFDDHDNVIKCRVEESYTLHIHPKPVIDEITISTTTICSGGQVTLTAYPNQNNWGIHPVYTWFRNGIEIPGAYLNTFTESPLAIDDDVTIYTYNAIVTYENSGCASILAEDLAVSVTTYRNPIVVISGDANICETNDVFLKASVDHMSDEVGDLSYTWYESGEEREIDPDFAPSGQFYSEHWPAQFEPYSFTVEVTRGDGCSTMSDPFLVWVHELPVVNITTTDETVCEGGSVTLTANLNDYNTQNMTIQWYRWEYNIFEMPLGDDILILVDSSAVLIPGATGYEYVTGPLAKTDIYDPKFEVRVLQTHSLCSATDIKWITVTPIPVVNVVAPAVEDTICSGEQITMNVNTTIDDVIVDNVTYEWYENNVLIDNATNASYTPMLTEAGVYVYKVRAIVQTAGCVSELTYVGTVTIKSAPAVVIAGPTTVCGNATDATLYAITDPENATVEYQWFLDGEAITGADTATLDISNLDPSPYPYNFTVKITDIESGCSTLSAVHQVNVIEFLVIGITADKYEVCAGENVIVTADVDYDSNMIYQWYANGDSIVGEVAPVLQAHPLVTTIYTFTAQQIGSECKAVSNALTVTVIAAPIITVVPIVDTICKGEQVTFTATLTTNDAVTYTWFIDGTQVIGAELGTFTHIFDHYGVFEIKVSATSEFANCTSDMVLAGTITVKDAPAVTIAGPTTICGNAVDATLYAITDPEDATVDYQWFLDGTAITGEDTATLDISNLDPSPYPYNFTVKITDNESGCVILSEVHPVYVNEFLVVGITADKYEVCAGDNVIVTANVSEDPNMIYQWYANGDSIVGEVGPVLQVHPLVTTIYTFTAQQIESECKAVSNALTVTVIAAPVITVVPVIDTICKGEQVTFTATLTTNDAVTYAWFIDGVKVDGAELGTFTHIFDHYGVFEVKVSATSELAGCTSEMVDAGTITVKDAPSVTIAGPTIICGEAADATLYAITDPEDATVDYQWFLDGTAITGEDTATLDISNLDPSPYPYNYTVQITDSESGCVILSAVHPVYVNDFPVIGITADKTEICAGETVTLTANVSEDPNMIYQWYADEDPIDDADAPILYVNPIISTVYTFTATQIGSECVATSNEIPVTVIPTPVITVVPVIDTICQGDQRTFTATLTTNEAVTYTWYIDGVKVEGADLATFTHIFDHYGIFEVKVSATSQVAGCTSEMVFAGKITVKAVPSVVISGPDFVCNAADPTVLYAEVDPSDATVTYQWFENGIHKGTYPTQVVSNIPDPAPYVYVVEITDIESGCVVKSLPHTVSVYQFPTFAATADKTEICPEETVLLTGHVTPNPNITYQWYADNVAIEGAITPSWYVNPATTVNQPGYQLYATQIVSGCLAISNPIPVIVIPTPVVTVANVIEDTICQWEQVTFNATVIPNLPAIYTWYKNDQVIFGAEESAHTILFDEPGVFIITVKATTEAAECSSAIVYAGTITVKAAPSVSIAGPTAVCDASDPTVLYAIVKPENATVTYQWYENGNPMGTEPTQQVSNESSPYPYVYKVVITDLESGCQITSDPHSVYVSMFSQIAIHSSKEQICIGMPFWLDADAPDIDNMIWQWFEDYLAITGGNSPSHEYTPTSPGDHIYYFQGIQLVSGCKVTSNEITVKVDPIPAAPVLTISPTTICSGDPVTISGNIEGDYDWYRMGMSYVQSSEPTITDQPTANNELTTYNYSATVTINGCTSAHSAPVYVEVHPEIEVTIFGAHDVCDQALEDEHLALHAIVTGKQDNVTYEYAWFYRQGNNPKVNFYTEFDDEGEYAVVPNNLDVSDPAAPYCITVEVKAINYNCTAVSPCHEVNVQPKPEVQIAVADPNICLDGSTWATAYVDPTPTPENPYTYFWSVNGTELPFTEDNNIEIKNEYLHYGINDIAITVYRSYGPGSCHGTTTANVSVLSVPSLVVSQNIEGLQLPGMCVGGQVNLQATVVDFDVTLIDPSDFIFEWRRTPGAPITNPYDFYSEKLNVPGTYTYSVRAYLDNNLGCNAQWTDFAAVKVVPQASIEIYPKDYIYNDVCQGAAIEISNKLTVEDAAIQVGKLYCWNDMPNDCAPFTSQIDPRTIEFNYTGDHSFYLNAEFMNPTCNAVASNVLVYHVKDNPIWKSVTIDPKPEDGLCLGDIVTLDAVYSGGVPEDYSIGYIEWYYSLDGGNNVFIGLGGHQTHKPVQAGNYTYIATYSASNPISGCYIDPYPMTIEAIQPTTPKAKFANEGVPQTCANDPKYTLEIVFTDGTAPYNFTLLEQPGGLIRNLISPTDHFYLDVKPSVTTQYTIESLNDMSKCVTGVFAKSDITVVVTDIVVVNPYVATCDPTVDVYLNVTDLVSKTATITFAGASWNKDIQKIGNQYLLNIDIPAEAPSGDNNVLIFIDGCEYPIVVNVGRPVVVNAVFKSTLEDLQRCANDPTASFIPIEVHFEGTPPFKYLFVGTDGTNREITSFTNDETILVSPTATTTYHIESLMDESPCVLPGSFVRPLITVTITNVEFVSPEVATCDNSVNVEFYVISSLSNIATITFEGSLPKSIQIKQGYNSITVDIPNGIEFGANNVVLAVDECEFGFTIIVNHGGIGAGTGTGNQSLIFRKWEGYGEVLVVSNNYMNPGSPYYNGGYEFTSYQWYKNGVIIPGATKQYYQDPDGVNGIYTVHLTGFKVDINGNHIGTVEFSTCDEAFNPSTTVKVYPVPAQTNEPITVELDLTPAELEGALLDIYDAKGALVKHLQVVSSRTIVDGFRAQGTYWGRITTGTNEIKAIKFVIVK
ncbi:MAG: PKD domain-containing protein [Bacteroidales bacterium]|jgi:hypothetical protein|nr:PKD domain-containing protein [Bacteroidales bacterium]